MKSFLPALLAVLVLASCSTAYKSGQTPDDVYYSPQRPSVAARIQDSQDEYVRMDRNDNRRYNYNEEENYDDYYLRMKVRNRDRWALLDNELYFNNYTPYSYNPYLSYSPFGYQNFGSPFNNYYSGFGNYYGYGYPGFSLYRNYYNPYYYNYSPYGYNPYGHQVIVVNPRGPVYNRPRTSNLNIYNNRPDVNSSRPRGSRVYSNDNTYYNTESNNTRSRNSGNTLRNVFNNNNSSNNNNSNQNTTPSRSYSTPSTSTPSSSSSGSSSGGSAPVRRF